MMLCRNDQSRHTIDERRDIYVVFFVCMQVDCVLSLILRYAFGHTFVWHYLADNGTALAVVCACVWVAQ